MTKMFPSRYRWRCTMSNLFASCPEMEIMHLRLKGNVSANCRPLLS